MAEADGSIRIPVKIDLASLKKGLSEAKKELEKAEKEYADLEKQYADQTARYKKRIAQGGADGAQAKKEMARYQEQKGKELDAAFANLEKRRIAQESTAAYTDRMSGAVDASKQVDRAVADDKFVSGIQTQEKYNSLLSQTRAEMARIEAQAARISAQTGKPVKDILAVNESYQKAANTAKLLETRSDDIADNIKRTERNLKKVNNATKKVGDSTKHGIAGFGKMQLMMMGIMMATRAISAATQEYMATNSELEGQLNTLRSLWGQVLGPAIEWVINLLMQAITAVNAFVQALTGINFVARANEAALKKQAKAAGGAAKAAQLAGFDEQTKLNDTSGGGGGDPVSLLDASLDNLPAFIEKMMEQIASGDWYGAGKTAGEALMDGISSADWKSIGSTIGEILSGAVSFALGFALNLDPVQILDAAVRLVTGFIEGVTETVQGMDWVEVGGDIVDFFISGLIVSLILTNPFATLIALIFTPTGQELTTAAAELIGSIIGALLTALFGAAQRIGEIGIELWNTIKSYFDEYVDWEGTPEEIVNGLFNGIVNALKSVGTWIYNNVWVPFRDGFKEAFDINSPSKRMEDFGGDIISGLYNGIINGLSKIRQACQTIWTTIKGVFSSVGTWFKNTFSDAWQKVKDVFSSGGKIFDGIKEGISSTFKTIVNGLISGINRVIAVPFNAINRTLNTIRGVSVLGISPFSGLWSYNPLSVPQIPKLALGGIVNRPGRGVPAIIGEAGAEAVLPLENNTEWMDVLADKIGGGTVIIPIYLDEKRIATYMVDIQKKKAFATNGA